MIYLCSLTINLTDLVFFKNIFCSHNTFLQKGARNGVCAGASFLLCLKYWVERADLKDRVDLHVLNIKLEVKCVKSGLWILHQPNHTPLQGVMQKLNITNIMAHSKQTKPKWMKNTPQNSSSETANRQISQHLKRKTTHLPYSKAFTLKVLPWTFATTRVGY